MSAAANYLNRIYLDEEIKRLDENFASWAKQIGMKKLANKFYLAGKQKDNLSISKIVSAIPKVDADKLKSIGKKAHKNFDKAYRITVKEVKKNFPELTGDKLKYFSLIITPYITVSEDMEKNAKDKIIMIRKKSRDAGFKKFDGGQGTLGMFLAILAGAFAAAAIANIALFPLLLAIVIAAFASLFVLQGVFS